MPSTNYYSSTVTPMLRAVPATIRIALSMFAAFISGILTVAISAPVFGELGYLYLVRLCGTALMPSAFL